jgi:lipoprotein NlpD
MGTGNFARRRLFLAAGLSGLLLTAGLSGCGSLLRWDADTHTVREGETLYSIAFRYGLSQQDLAAWNGLGDGRLIYPGQKLRLTKPDSAAARRAPATGRSGSRTAKAVPHVPVGDWRWPADGPVVEAFSTSPRTQSGMQIGGQRGQSIRAASGGQVVYAGSGLKSYGQLVIIKHNASYLSAYGHNQELLVSEGERVKGGQQIALMGEGPGRKPLLHFEIRRDGKPVNPLAFLPRR